MTQLPPPAAFDDVIELENGVPFDPSKWISRGRIYKNAPEEVSDAFIAACKKIPPTLAATLPSPAISVTTFLAIKLPGILPNMDNVPKQTEDWFSSELPNCDPIPALWSVNSIPPDYFLRELESDSAQKWLNGAKSIRDPSNNSLRLPLFALAFYREIHRLSEAQEKWTCSMEWVRDELPQYDLTIFASVSWNSVHPGAPDGQLDWTRLVDDEWLSGGIIDNMMMDIQSRVAEIPALDAALIVAPLSFQRAIVAASTHQNPSRYTVKLLDKYKRAMDSGKSQLYFPLHINGNHWIAFVIDFVRKTFGYGDSFGRKLAAKEFIGHLTKWLDRVFPGGFQNLGDFLLHHKQRDYVHCGIYTSNTLEHAIFKAKLISHASDCRILRFQWFKKFASLDTGAMPPLANHNFPELGPENFFEDAIPSPPDSMAAPPTSEFIVAIPSASLINHLMDSHVLSPTESAKKLNAPVATGSLPNVPLETAISAPEAPTPPLKKRKAKPKAPDNSEDSDDSADEQLTFAALDWRQSQPNGIATIVA
ncbi:hypothetical protein B0H10DRAFT_1960191 [Mycena sp. CBHHK59/15]|nr:hypothetical protein B0H10DRAFT_1960191 [Mycena sp. CBHHK59/15]